MMSLFKRTCLVSAFACGTSGAALAQTVPPALPPLTTAQQAQVEQQMQSYSAEVDARIGRGEIDPNEAQRLLAWREWQLASQVAGLTTPPEIVSQPTTVVRDYAYPPYYGPYYYPPRYYAPGPVYWGPSVCAGGFGHHWGGRVCF